MHNCAEFGQFGLGKEFGNKLTLVMETVQLLS